MGALSAGLPKGVDKMVGALIAADRCSLNATQARANLNVQLLARLEPLKLALETNRSTQAVQDLAFMLDAARRLDLEGKETQAARLVVQELVSLPELDNTDFARALHV